MWTYFFHNDFFGWKYDLKLDGNFIIIIIINIIILGVFAGHYFYQICQPLPQKAKGKLLILNIQGVSKARSDFFFAQISLIIENTFSKI